MPIPYLLISNQDHLTQAVKLATAEKIEPISTTNLDVKIFNATGEGLPIETVRDLKNELVYRPLKGLRRTVILCHLEMASIPAQNALLKTLEEPPEYVNVIAVTTNVEKILPTIQSRCRVVQIAAETADLSETKEVVKKVSQAGIAQRIEMAEGYKDRDTALKLADQLIHYYHQSAGPTRIKNLELLLKIKDYLQHNTNPQLTIERLFLELK